MPLPPLANWPRRRSSMRSKTKMTQSAPVPRTPSETFRPVTRSPEAVAALTRTLSDSSEWVRRNSAEALGAIGQPAPETVPALGQLLSDELEWIRDNAARALAKIGPEAGPAVPSLVSALRDESRYVRFNACVALKRIDTDAAREALYEELLTSRWCPITTDDSPF